MNPIVSTPVWLIKPPPAGTGDGDHRQLLKIVLWTGRAAALGHVVVDAGREQPAFGPMCTLSGVIGSCRHHSFFLRINTYACRDLWRCKVNGLTDSLRQFVRALKLAALLENHPSFFSGFHAYLWATMGDDEDASIRSLTWLKRIGFNDPVRETSRLLLRRQDY